MRDDDNDPLEGDFREDRYARARAIHQGTNMSDFHLPRISLTLEKRNCTSPTSLALLPSWITVMLTCLRLSPRLCPFYLVAIRILV